MFHILRQRSDQLGANFIYKLRQIMLCKHLGIKVLLPPGQKYSDSLFFTPFETNIALLREGFHAQEVVDLRQLILNYRNKNNLVVHNHWCNLAFSLLHMGNLDLISQFNQTFKNSWLKSIQQHEKYKDPWGGKKVICVHLRLGDVSHVEKYSGEEEISDMIDIINKDERRLNKYRGQAPINDDITLKLLNEIRVNYPNHEIHFVASPIGPYNYDFPVHRSKDPDEDLLLLMHADVLVQSRSSFSLLAGLFHLGSIVYCPRWATAIQSGIDTKYDQSGWVSFAT